MERFTFFWSKHSCFSNWHPSDFLIEDIKYSCNEQFYMRSKAIYFGDEKAAAAIMNTDNPAVMKRIGKCIQGFKEDQWDDVAREFMKQGLIAKVIISILCIVDIILALIFF